MPLDHDHCYRAVASRDARFDGCFVIAVRTTGIYCRPSCPAMTPKSQNVTFLPTAAAAQLGGYRACRRCLPDAVPGSPEWDARGDLVARAVRLIADGVVERDGVPGLAALLGYSTRQLNRLLTAELGAGALALARAHRAQAARILTERTDLPFGDVAFAAGFASVRQFNDTVQGVYAATPTQLRAGAAGRVRAAAAGTITLRLPFRAPLDRAWLQWYLCAHAVTGVEDVGDGYGRSLRLPHGPGTVRLQLRDDRVDCTMRLADLRDLGAAVNRVRRLLDLDADPQAVDAALLADPALAPSVRAAPGLRVPGHADGGEVLLRTVLGQQVSLAAARTAASRLATALGEPLATADGAVTMLFPEPAVVAERGHEVLTGPRRRVASVLAVAAALADGSLDPHPGSDAAELRADLLALPGIGPWTASTVAMRVLGDPDVLLDTDLVLRQGAALLGVPADPTGLREHARRWAPWRSYAGSHLWRTALHARPHRRTA